MLSRWIADLESADPNVRSLALQELRQLGPAAREAVPALLAALRKTLGDPEQDGLRGALVGILETIGPDARTEVPLLVPLLRPDGGWGLDSAACAILRIGGERIEERLAVRSLLFSWGKCVAGNLLFSDREMMQQYADKIRPSLAELLTDSNAQCRVLAAQGLALYGTEAKPFVPALVAALNEPDVRVRIQVALALVEVEPERKAEASAALFPLLLNSKATQSVFSALNQMGADGVAYLRQELRGSSVAGRVGAARALGLLASQAPAAFEDLVTGLDDLVAGLESADAGIRGGAADILALLAQTGRSVEAALPALSKLLADPEVCLESALAVAAIDAGQAVAAVPILVDALERSKFLAALVYPYSGMTTEEAILMALGRIGRPAAVAVPLLRHALQSSNVDVQVRAASVLARLAPEWTTDAVATLLPLVSAVDDYDNFWKGIGALAEIGPGARETVPQLEELLFDEAKRGTSEFICPGEPSPLLFSALVRIDPTASARVLAHIEADLQSPERFDQAVKLLLEIAREIPAAAPLLAKLLKDRRAEGQWDAILKALDELELAPS